MDVRERLKNVKLGQAKEICDSLRSDLDRYENRGGVPSAEKDILNALRVGVHGLCRNLDELESSGKLDLLNEDAIETKIHLKTRYIQYFVEVLSLLESSSIRDVPHEVASPLRREIRKVFPDSDLLVVSKTNLNYTIQEVGSVLREWLKKLGCDVPREMPNKLFRVAIPSTTYKEALLLSIFGHEIGHPIYEEYGFEDDILPVNVNKDLLDKYTENIKEEKLDYETPEEEAEIRKEVTKKVTETIDNWVREISSDICGLRICGPSYVYSFIYFISSISRLDSSKKSHPPPRLRLKILIENMESLFGMYRHTSNQTRSFVKDWKSIANGNLSFSDMTQHIAHLSMKENGTYKEITSAVDDNIPEDIVYKDTQFEFDLDNLTPLISKQIPPVEVTQDGELNATGMTSILNSSWESYIQGLDGFQKSAIKDESFSQVSEVFNSFVLKSLELSDVKESWDHVTNDIKQ